jgi:hypothetical protein
MGGFAMRLFALVTICVTLLGCADTDPFASARANRVALTNDSENVHAVMGQPVTLDPLTTEPGDVWADVSSGKPAPASPQQARRLPTPSLADEANNATPAQVPASQSAVMPFETKAQTPTPATRHQDASPRHYTVQLTAAASQTAALKVWQGLQKEIPQLIEGREPSVIMAVVAGRSLWRLRTGGFSDRADADAFCSRIQAQHSQCWVVADTP